MRSAGCSSDSVAGREKTEWVKGSGFPGAQKRGTWGNHLQWWDPLCNPGTWASPQRLPAKATEGDEVKCTGFLVTDEFALHEEERVYVVPTLSANRRPKGWGTRLGIALSRPVTSLPPTPAHRKKRDERGTASSISVHRFTALDRATCQRPPWCQPLRHSSNRKVCERKRNCYLHS